MGRVTYFVALPFGYDPEGSLCAGEAVETKTAEAARRRAASLAVVHAGAIAFARTGDLELGDYDDAEVLARYGEVPEDVAALIGT